MWCNHAYTLAPLTKLLWTSVGKNYFMVMNKIVGRDVLISYPNFSGQFIIHMDAKKRGLGE